MDNDYRKIKPHEEFTWPACAARLFNGFCLRRSSWPEGDFAFMCRNANYTAMDYTTGFVENFLVRKVGLKEFIFLPSDEDLAAKDWQVFTRQETHSFPRYGEQRDTRRTIEPEIIDITPQSDQTLR